MILKIIKFIKKISKIIKPSANPKEQLEFLKSIIDVSSLKPASGRLREYQLRYLNFAKELQILFDKIEIKPFLAAGTLCGAIRHKGYIPWDDDIDFWVTREDYNKLINYAQQNQILYERKGNRFNNTNKVLEYEDNLVHQNPNKLFFILSSNVLQLYKGTSIKDYSVIDIFPIDFYNDNYSFEEYKKYTQKIQAKLWKINNYIRELHFLQQEREKNTNIVKNSKKLFYGIDNIGSYIPSQLNDFWNYDDIFPLKKVVFEDTEFWVPNNSERVLDLWCPKWRGLPNDIGYPHHLAIIDKYLNKKYKIKNME